MFRHKHKFSDKPLVVSGYGLTEYEITFCRECGRVFWRLTKDIEDLYPKYKDKKWR